MPIIQPRRWTTQPPAGVPAARDGIAAGLSFLWTPRRPLDDTAYGLTNSTTTGGGVKLTTGPSGVAGTNPSGSNNVVFNSSRFPRGNSQNYTVFAYVLDNGSAAIRIPIDCDDGGSARIFQLRFNSSNQPDFIPFNTGGSTFAATGSAAAPTIRPVLLLGRVSGTSVSVWLDGVQVGSNTLTGTAATVGQASTTVTIAAGHNGGSNFGGLIYLAGHAARAWSDAEIVSVSANPWQLFAPQQRRLWVGAAAGGARTISATPGAWNWAGTTSAPAVQTIAQTVGAFTWAGTTASIPTPSISQTPGAWNWAGTTANFNSITTISATPGAWTWAGTTASIPAQALSATPGAYSWAGTTSGIGVANIAATPGAWNWQGTTQGIIQLVTISASPGLWNWQGTQAGVTNPSASVTIRAGSWIRYRTI